MPRTILGIIDTAIEDINAKRGAAGALSNRRDFIKSNLDNSKVNLIKSRSNIEDTDFAAGECEISKRKNIGTGCDSDDRSGEC